MKRFYLRRAGRVPCHRNLTERDSDGHDEYYSTRIGKLYWCFAPPGEQRDEDGCVLPGMMEVTLVFRLPRCAPR